jgi:hypothetical protein
MPEQERVLNCRGHDHSVSYPAQVWASRFVQGSLAGASGEPSNKFTGEVNSSHLNCSTTWSVAKTYRAAAKLFTDDLLTPNMKKRHTSCQRNWEAARC